MFYPLYDTHTYICAQIWSIDCCCCRRRHRTAQCFRKSREVVDVIFMFSRCCVLCVLSESESLQSAEFPISVVCTHNEHTKEQTTTKRVRTSVDVFRVVHWESLLRNHENVTVAMPLTSEVFLGFLPLFFHSIQREKVVHRDRGAYNTHERWVHNIRDT